MPAAKPPKKRTWHFAGIFCKRCGLFIAKAKMAKKGQEYCAPCGQIAALIPCRQCGQNLIYPDNKDDDTCAACWQQITAPDPTLPGPARDCLLCGEVAEPGRWYCRHCNNRRKELEKINHPVALGLRRSI